MTSTRYGQVAQLLRQAIASGETAPAGALPTEAELCDRYDASRTTVRRALLELRDEGLVESRQGSGWTVPPRHRGPQTPRYRVRSGDGTRARAPTSELLGHHRRRPPRDIAAILNARGPRPLLMVERITRVGGKPIHRAEVWFNPAHSARLDSTQACEHPPARLLAQHGQAFGHFDQYVQAVGANRRDHQLLDLQIGKPILQVIRTAYAPDGAPLFHSLHRHPGHEVELEIWLPTTNQPHGAGVTIESTW
jgi:GntR family transcriptional regulator